MTIFAVTIIKISTETRIFEIPIGITMKVITEIINRMFIKILIFNNNSNRNFNNTRQVNTAHASDLNFPFNQPQIQYVCVPVNSQINNDVNNRQSQMMRPNNNGHMQNFPQGHLNGQSNAQR
jgi:hypothetical protein